MPLKNLRFILFACQSFSITTRGSLKYDPPQSKKLFSPPRIQHLKILPNKGYGEINSLYKFFRLST